MIIPVYLLNEYHKKITCFVGVIDLTSEVDTTDEMQKAIAASLQDQPGILGGQISREDQEISRFVLSYLAHWVQQTLPAMILVCNLVELLCNIYYSGARIFSHKNMQKIMQIKENVLIINTSVSGVNREG